MELTGAFASIGEPGLEGIKARVEEINRRGGIKGRLLELVIIDDKGDTNNAVLNVKRMIEADKVHAVIAGIITMVAQAVKPIAADTQCPIIGLSGTSGSDRPAQKWYFRPCKVELGEFVGVDDFLKGKGVKKIAVLYQAAPTAKLLCPLPRHGYKSTASKWLPQRALTLGTQM